MVSDYQHEIIPNYHTLANKGYGKWWQVTFSTLAYTRLTSSIGNIFRVTGLLSGESNDHQWISLTKASDAEHWYYLWFSHEQRLSKQSRPLWFEKPSRSFWGHSNTFDWFTFWHTHRKKVIHENSSRQEIIPTAIRPELLWFKWRNRVQALLKYTSTKHP